MPICEEKKFQFFLFLFLMCSFSLTFCSSSIGAPAKKEDGIAGLKNLYDQKRYFELYDAVKNYKSKTNSKLLFYRGVAASSLYQPQTAINYLSQYLSRAGNDDELLADTYTLLADNFAKKYEYAKAADACRTLVTRLKNRLKPDEITDYENGAALYGALEKISRQTVIVSKDTAIGEAGKENGWNIPVEANNQRIALGFDTGANISILAESVAKKLGVRILDVSVKLGTITSIRVLPKVGVLTEMKIGNAVVRNAIFLVLDDKNLTFEDGTMIEGVVGFPVISGFRRITFNRDGTVFIPRKLTGKRAPNMRLERCNILFRGDYESRKLDFTLDTGASRSILYVPFLTDFENEIKDKYEMKTERFTGVGGSEELPAYLIKNFTLGLSGKTARLPEIRLLTKALNNDGKYFYGNIGTDFIKQYKSMTLDFDSMNIAFE